VKCDKKPLWHLFSFRLSHLLPERHLNNFAVGLAFRFHHGVAVDVHGGRDLSVPH